MGCAASTPLENEEEDYFIQDKKINDTINQQLVRKKQNERQGVKLLLLGAGESGKSTVLKQMKLLHKGGFTQQERRQYSNVIWADVIQSMKTLIIQGRKLKIPLDCDAPKSKLIPYKQIVLRNDGLNHIDAGAAGGASFINDYLLKYSEDRKNKRRMKSTGIAEGSFWKSSNEGGQPEDDEEIDNELLEEYYQQQQHKFAEVNYSRMEIADAIHKLWTQDKGIKRCYERSNEFHFETSADYYFNNVLKFADPNYLCTDLDILKGRVKTTGIAETNFSINSFQFKVLDAGGQRSERKKWIHCFEGITAVLFVLAISEYDQMLFEDERVNRMHESIVLFDSLCNSKWFENTPFILFLNKIDIFEKKLKKSPLVNYFPGYQGKPDDVDEAIKFFEVNFLKMNRTKKPIYVHRTCATDTQSMKFILSAVTDMVIQQNMKKSGLI